MQSQNFGLDILGLSFTLCLAPLHWPTSWAPMHFACAGKHTGNSSPDDNDMDYIPLYRALSCDD